MKNYALHKTTTTLPLPARLAGLAADHLDDRGRLKKVNKSSKSHVSDARVKNKREQKKKFSSFLPFNFLSVFFIQILETENDKKTRIIFSLTFYKTTSLPQSTNPSATNRYTLLKKFRHSRLGHRNI